MVEKACGCVIIEDEKVLLIQQNDGVWGFPKGHMEEGETEVETAIREVKEETNVEVKLNANEKYKTEYILPNGNQKQVIFFIAKKIGGEEKIQEKELQNLKWCNFEEAMEQITYDNIKEILKKIIKKTKTA